MLEKSKAKKKPGFLKKWEPNGKKAGITGIEIREQKK